MIRIIFDHNDHNDIISFKLMGHANSGKYGQDIVCAAVSALSISTVNSLFKIANIKPKVISDDVNGGLLNVKINNCSDQLKHDRAQTLLLNLENGLVDISKNYGKYIQLKINA
ncbi:hypothetical protein WR164_07740 [Philodulcilactobacillus myokoensis]|uniref:Ribosomal processing cysteine protease Prp n=1 Tax=Philodulcilactobacillus myokoensis TaxID=2929573 RepID=A0A9W6B0T1_9LACO|nr:ribosomal-processing cysteine protease Prp [Philodulcilactobacillus myokoensis]GLB46795.1 hypothetical protein WR164_07740 [Philodulcilactobacillus myokoensis]